YPVKDLAENALQVDDRISGLERRYGVGVDDVNSFSRRLKRGPRELRAVRRESGLQPAQIVEFQNEYKTIRKDLKKLEDNSKITKEHLIELYRQIRDGQRATGHAHKQTIPANPRPRIS